MKQLLLCALAALAGVAGKVYAQHTDFQEYFALSPTEKMFTMQPWVSIRDVLYFNDEQMIFELRKVQDYKYLRGLDTILQRLQTDIAFYRDSLENDPSNVRIDYLVHSDRPQREVRFIKHRPKGEPFIVMDGETARLKIERDTIRIVVSGLVQEDGYGYKVVADKRMPARYTRLVYEAQVTIVLNRYSNIGNVKAKWPTIQQSIDKFVTSRTKKETEKPTSHPTQCIYRPYLTDSALAWMRFRKFELEEKADVAHSSGIKANGKFTFFCNVGGGLTRNTAVPLADVGFALNERIRNSGTHYLYTAISATPVFFFSRNGEKDFYIHDNWFLNLERGSTVEDGIMGLSVQSYSWGLSWLALQKGNYFQGFTMRFFTNACFKSGITLAPEIIASDSFRQIFPGISVKLPIIRS